MPRNAVLFPTLALLLFAAVWLTLRGFRYSAPLPEIAEIERPRYHLDGADWVRYDETGTPLFEIRAMSVDYFDDESMQMQKVSVQQLGGESGAWQLTSTRGEVPPQARRLLLEPDVTVIGDPPRQQGPVTMQAPQLWIDWETRQLTTASSVAVQAPGRSLTAVGMNADWTGRRIEFENQVNVRHAAPR